MRKMFARILSAAAIALILPLGGANSASAQSVMKQCGGQWQAAKAAGTINGQTWTQFLKDCRTRLASTTSNPASNQGGFAPPNPAPRPAPVQAPAAPSMHTVPSPPPTQAPTEAPYASLPAQMTPGEFASDAQARAHCPTDTVVWVNARSRVYHFAGTHNYGHTKEGAYMCEADAEAAGNRAAKNERHP
jgi:hypothetical protein